MKKSLSAILCLILSVCFVLTSCGENKEVKTYDDLTIDKTQLELQVGEKYTYIVKNGETNINLEELVWQSSDETIATVEKGEVVAVKNGTTIITAIVDKKALTSTVTVKDKELTSSNDNTSSETASSKPQTTTSSKPQSTTSSKPQTTTSSKPQTTTSSELQTTTPTETDSTESKPIITPEQQAIRQTSRSKLDEKQLEEDLNAKFKSVDLGIDVWSVSFTVYKNSDSFWLHDVQIYTEYPLMSTVTPYDLDDSIDYTTEQKNKAINALKNFQKQVYEYVYSQFPCLTIKGSYYYGFYKYPSINAGYTATKFCSWTNYGPDYAWSDIYGKYYITEFSFQTDSDDFKF